MRQTTKTAQYSSLFTYLDASYAWERYCLRVWLPGDKPNNDSNVAFRVATSFSLSISTPHHTLSQRRTISFYYSLYYTRGTAVVASIQGVSRRKIFRETPAHSLAEHFAMCGRVSLRNLGAEFVLAV